MESKNLSQLSIDIPNYSGPLDILLDLAKSQKVDLAEISITKLADQFLEFIKNNKNLEDLMKLNSRTYCYLLNDNDLQNLKNKFFSEKILQVYREPCN